MFDDFRKSIKIIKKEKRLTYKKLSIMIGISENTIKCFMSGANDSRRVAEKLADALNVSIIYNNNQYKIEM